MSLPEINNTNPDYQSLGVMDDNGSVLALTPGSVRFRSVKLSAAEIIAAHDTPVTIVPAQGANKLAVVSASAYYYKFGTTAFTGGSGSRLFYGDPTNALHADVGDNDCATGTVDQVAIGGPNGSANSIQGDATDLVNQPLVFSGPTAYAAGDGSMLIGVYYSVFDVSTGL